MEALNAKKLDLEFLIDPLFRKTSAAFDEGGVKGLLLNHLSVHNVLHGCELVFDSVDAVDVDGSNTASSDRACDISDLQGMMINNIPPLLHSFIHSFIHTNQICWLLVEMYVTLQTWRFVPLSAILSSIKKEKHPRWSLRILSQQQKLKPSMPVRERKMILQEGLMGVILISMLATTKETGMQVLLLSLTLTPAQRTWYALIIPCECLSSIYLAFFRGKWYQEEWILT